MKLDVLKNTLLSRSTLRAVIALIVFVALWEVGSRSGQWLGFTVPWVGQVDVYKRQVVEESETLFDDHRLRDSIERLVRCGRSVEIASVQ